MSLEKQDIRCKADPADHAWLKAEADTEGLEIAEFCTRVLAAHVAKRRRMVSEAKKLHEAKGIGADLLGKAGKFAERDPDGGTDLDLLPE